MKGRFRGPVTPDIELSSFPAMFRSLSLVVQRADGPDKALDLALVLLYKYRCVLSWACLTCRFRPVPSKPAGGIG